MFRLARVYVQVVTLHKGDATKSRLANFLTATRKLFSCNSKPMLMDELLKEWSNSRQSTQTLYYVCSFAAIHFVPTNL